MFELDDSKLGKVKLVSVTEARQHISTIMQDFGVHYVITKNSKPVRMIVDYEAFKQTTTNLSHREPASGGHGDPESGLRNLARNEVEKPAPVLKPEPEKREVLQKQEEISIFEAKIDTPKPTLKTKKIKFPDIFHHEAPSQKEVTETDFEKSETTENIEKRLHSTEATNQVWETEKTQADNEDWIIESHDEKTTRDFKEETQPLDEISINPEKEAYFKRFRKLYEPLSKPKHVELDQNDYWKNDPPSFADDELRRAGANDAPEIDEAEAPSESGHETLASLKNDFEASLRTKKTPSPTDSNDPPSIEDILKALEDEKL